MPTAFWRSPDIREQLNFLDRPGFAIEFLRRNPDYRADFEQICNQGSCGAADAEALRSGLAHRWGLAVCP